MRLNIRQGILNGIGFLSLAISIRMIPLFISYGYVTSYIYEFTNVFSFIMLIPTATYTFIGLMQREAKYCSQCGAKI